MACSVVSGFIQNDDRPLEYYGGDGYCGVPERGRFEVKTSLRLANRTFTRLSKARKYYDNLNIEKSLWDIKSVPELLEAHFK